MMLATEHNSVGWNYLHRMTSQFSTEFCRRR